MASAGGPNQDGLITIRVGGTPPTLSYAPDGNVVKADANSQKPKKHHVVKEDGVSWTCPDGAFAILFEKSPFKQGETSLGGARNSTSRPAKTSSVLKQTTFKYTVVVVTAVGAEPIIDDPELEVDPGGGGPG